MKEESGQTDVAALAAGVVAVSVSMFVTAGPYDGNGAIVAITLALILYGYMWQHIRSPSQSLALGAVAGVIAMPIAGVLFEYLIEVWRIYPPQVDHDGNPQSAVPLLWLWWTWIFVGGIVWWLDRRSVLPS